MYEATVPSPSFRTAEPGCTPAETAMRAHPIKFMHAAVLASLGLTALTAMGAPAAAEEATMRLRGSTQTFTGNVISFDGKSYLIENEIFGQIYIDTGRFECIAGACAGPDTAATASQENPTIAPSGSKAPRSPLTEEQRQELFKGFLEWRRKSRDN